MNNLDIKKTRMFLRIITQILISSTQSKVLVIWCDCMRKKIMFLFAFGIILALTSQFISPIHSSSPIYLHSNKSRNNLAVNTVSTRVHLSETNQLQILFPRSSIPKIITNNESFLVAVNTTLSVINWSFKIKSLFEEVSLVAENHTQEGTIHLFYLKSVNASAGLYNLSVTVTADKIYETEEPRAVSIVTSYPESYNFIVINDIKISPNSPERETVFKEAIFQINMLRPAFVLIIGDIVNSIGESEATTESEYQTFYNLLQTFEVPTYVVPGNHEYYNNGKKYYDKYLGYWPNTPTDEQYHNYSFVFGDSIFVMVDTGAGNEYVTLKDSQIAWIEDTLNHSSAKNKFIAMHVPVFDGSTNGKQLDSASQQEITRIVETYNVTLVLEGHTHVDKKTVYNNHIYLETTSLGAEARQATLDNYTPHWGFRIVEIKNNSLSSFSYDEPFGDYSVPLYVDENNTATDYIATPIIEHEYQYNDTWHHQNFVNLTSHNKNPITLTVEFIFPEIPSNSSLNVAGGDSYTWTTFKNRTFVFVIVSLSPFGDAFINVSFTVKESSPTINSIHYKVKMYIGPHDYYTNFSIDEVNVTDIYKIAEVTLYYTTTKINQTEKVSLQEKKGIWFGGNITFRENCTLYFWIVAVNIYGGETVSINHSLPITVMAPSTNNNIPTIYLEFQIALVVGAITVVVILGVKFYKERKKSL